MGTAIRDVSRIDRYETAYSASLGFEAVQVRHRQDTVLERLRRHRPAQVLEVGCGADPLVARALADPDVSSSLTRWIAVDPVCAFLDATEAAGDGDGRVVAVEGFIEDEAADLARRFGPPDLVVCASLLHEIDDPLDLLGTLASLCGPETVVHVSVPNAYSLHRRLARAMGLIGDEHEMSGRNHLLEQRQVFDTASLSRLVGLSGLEVVDSGGILLKPFTHSQMLELPFLDERMLDGLAALGAEMPELASEIWVEARPAGT
jgi:2-polyprenyl-3-methyl-5-hydroxy-6-metoxy-1,4-benzoquinol methylase